jgi:diguanylate cyclase (GGDEF)-like protein
MNDKKHILMVDDVATNLKCAAEIFKDDFRLSMEKSGENALLFLKQIKPDLVILDINMPNMDGYEFLEQMKSDPECAHIPVVFLTSDSDMESEIKSLRMGAMDFIRKPFDPQVMISRIHKILEIEDIKKELSLKSCTDSLTGLWDRKYFEEQVNDSLEQNNQGVFFLIDLDNFKTLMIPMDISLGDDVLKSFCDKVLVLSQDHMFAGRLGGDEFAVFIRGKMEINQTKETALLLIQNLNHAIMNCIGYLEGVGVSVGISVADRDGKDFLTRCIIKQIKHCIM